MNDLIMRAQIYFTIFMRRKSFIKEENPIHNCLDVDNSWKSGIELTCIVALYQTYAAHECMPQFSPLKLHARLFLS